MSGSRNIYSYNEYSNGYAHSHLLSINFTNYKLEYKGFCLGSGEIRFLFSKLSSEFNSQTYKMILFHLKGYLEWESLEGVPYVKLEDLFIKSKNNGLPYVALSDLNYHYSILLQINKQRGNQLDWQIQKNKAFDENILYRIKDNDKLEEFCVWENHRYYNSTPINLSFYKDEQGEYYPINSTMSSIVIQEDAFLPFHGEKNKIIIEGVLDESSLGKRKTFIHPQIKNYVKRQIEFKVNQSAIKDSAIKRLKNKS